MLHILNARERNRAFLQFLIFFLLTVSLVVGAVYFNFQVPIKQNEILNEKNDHYRNADLQQQKFVARINEVRNYLDSFEKGGVNEQQIEMQLTSKMIDLSNLQQNDSSIYAGTNQAIIGTFSQLKNALVSLKSFREKADKATEYERKYKESENKLDQFRHVGDYSGIQH